MPSRQTSAAGQVSTERIYTGVPSENGKLRAAPSDWAQLEGEVAQYFQNEPGVGSVNLDSNGGGGFGSRTLSFAPGTDPLLMMTVADRVKAADRFMPMRTVRYEKHWVDGQMHPTQQPVGRDIPSASQVLRAAYGTQAAKYDDSAPSGARLLEQARQAYTAAAREVPRRARRSLRDAILARFDREFGK